MVNCLRRAARLLFSLATYGSSCRRVRHTRVSRDMEDAVSPERFELDSDLQVDLPSDRTWFERGGLASFWIMSAFGFGSPECVGFGSSGLNFWAVWIWFSRFGFGSPERKNWSLLELVLPNRGIVKARASIGGFRHPRHMSYNPSSHSFCTTLRWPGDSHALSQSRRNVAFRLISQQNNRDYYSVCGRLDKRMRHACNVCYLHVYVFVGYRKAWRLCMQWFGSYDVCVLVWSRTQTMCISDLYIEGLLDLVCSSDDIGRMNTTFQTWFPNDECKPTGSLYGLRGLLATRTGYFMWSGAADGP